MATACYINGRAVKNNNKDNFSINVIKSVSIKLDAKEKALESQVKKVKVRENLLVKLVLNRRLKN